MFPDSACALTFGVQPRILRAQGEDNSLGLMARCVAQLLHDWEDGLSGDRSGLPVPWWSGSAGQHRRAPEGISRTARQLAFGMTLARGALKPGQRLALFGDGWERSVCWRGTELEIRGRIV